MRSERIYWKYLPLDLTLNLKTSLKILYKILARNKYFNKNIGVIISFCYITTHCNSTVFTQVQNIRTKISSLTLIFKKLLQEQKFKAA